MAILYLNVQILNKHIGLFQNRNEANFLPLKGRVEGRKGRRKEGGRKGRKEGRKQQSPISIISLNNELLVGACKYKNSPLTRCLHNVLHFI